MNTKKIVAYLFGLMSLGAISETHSILTSSAPDIAPQRGILSIMAICITGLFIYVAINFWKRRND